MNEAYYEQTETFVLYLWVCSTSLLMIKWNTPEIKVGNPGLKFVGVVACNYWMKHLQYFLEKIFFIYRVEDCIQLLNRHSSTGSELLACTVTLSLSKFQISFCYQSPTLIS